jgi:hypothetical protein
MHADSRLIVPELVALSSMRKGPRALSAGAHFGGSVNPWQVVCANRIFPNPVHQEPGSFLAAIGGFILTSGPNHCKDHFVTLQRL